MPKRYDEDIARIGKAMRENDEIEALNRATGLLADFMNTQERIVELLDSIDSRLIAVEEEAVNASSGR